MVDTIKIIKESSMVFLYLFCILAHFLHALSLLSIGPVEGPEISFEKPEEPVETSEEEKERAEKLEKEQTAQTWQKAETPQTQPREGLRLSPERAAPVDIESQLQQVEPEKPEKIAESEETTQELATEMGKLYEAPPDIVAETQPTKGFFKGLWDRIKTFVTDVEAPETDLSKELSNWEKDISQIVNNLVEIDKKIQELLEKRSMSQEDIKTAQELLKQVDTIAENMGYENIFKAMERENRRLSIIESRARERQEITKVTAEGKNIRIGILTDFELLSKTYDDTITKLKDKPIDELYQILNIDPGENPSKITQQQIDKAFEDMGRPPRTPENEPIHQALNILNDPGKKAEYDAFLKDYSKLKKARISPEFKETTVHYAEKKPKEGKMIILDTTARKLLKEDSAVSEIIPTEKEIEQIKNLQNIMKAGGDSVIGTWADFKDRVDTLTQRVQSQIAQ